MRCDAWPHAMRFRSIFFLLENDVYRKIMFNGTFHYNHTLDAHSLRNMKNEIECDWKTLAFNEISLKPCGMWSSYDLLHICICVNWSDVEISISSIVARNWDDVFNVWLLHIQMKFHIKTVAHWMQSNRKKNNEIHQSDEHRSCITTQYICFDSSCFFLYD